MYYNNPYNPEELKRIEEERKLKEKIDGLIKTIFTKEAVQRINNVKLVNEELAYNVMMFIIEQVEKGNIRTVDDNYLKNVLNHFHQQLSKKSNYKIIRK